MSGDKSILVLHGITMSGASMLRTLGPLGARLEALGFSLIAPNAGHRMSPGEVNQIERWVEGAFAKTGQNPRDWFDDGRFWNAGEHYDWFDASTDAATGKKTYRAIEASLDAIADAIVGRRVSGVLGFSQGSAMAIALAARALEGDARFGALEWGVFLSGFKPVFDQPKPVSYPIRGDFRTLFVIGDKDGIFSGGREYLTTVSEAFDGTAPEIRLIPGLAHDVPASPEDVELIVEFVRKAR